MTTELSDYTGPLGPVGRQLARRRIAVARDRTGRVALVRPDSVVFEFGDDVPYADVRAAISARRLDVLGGEPAEEPASGTISARFDPSTRPTTPPERWRTGRLADLVGELRDAGHRVRPNHVYLADGVARHFGGIVGGGGSGGTPGISSTDAAVPESTMLESSVRPAVEPAVLPRPLDLPGRRRPNVVVLDTGLRTRAGRPDHPWLGNCIVHDPWRDGGVTGRWDDEDEPDDDGLGRLDHQAGHGTFISGVVSQICPDAVIHHSGALTSYGDGDDTSVFWAIERACRRLGPAIDIVVMAFGGYGIDDRPPPMAGAISRLLGDALVVASAGNDGVSRPSFPAALPDVVGVGALDSGGRASFSNFGPWVDACTPGVDVVSTFFTDVDDVLPDGRLANAYRGWACWSGTSFSAPKVAGAVAQEMYLAGGTAREAWTRILGRASHRRHDLGAVLNV